ncbi:50S ribosomal protein L5 [Candidatus Gottesmanbacteria bacterium]|nr:50S ribosomal protein L5 [Candidatus Gottesmanbacteria bacterium]
MSDLYNQFQQKLKKDLARQLGISNIMAVPKLEKIVINTGLGEALTNKKAIENMATQIAAVSGQKPIVTYAKKDISSFKLRKGDPVGLKVTLRRGRMYDFLDKFIKVTLPRIRDFRGVSNNSFDGKGCFTLGLHEQIVLPEIDYSKIDKIRGLEITIVTTAKDKTQTKKLLEILGVPFKKEH